MEPDPKDLQRKSQQQFNVTTTICQAQNGFISITFV